MRIPIVSALVLLLAVLSIPANADGGFVPMIDPASHAADITEPTQKALIVCNGKTEHLTLQVSFKGDASEFAWLVPTPSKPEVTKADDSVFHNLHLFTAPIMHYWFRPTLGINGPFNIVSGPARGEPSIPNVAVLDKKKVGVYDIAVLRAGNSDDLLKWLRTNGYQITPRVAPVLSDYISRGWVFTAMRINTSRNMTAKRLHKGILQSLQFSFPSTEPIYPLKISSLNEGTTDILLYVIYPHRVDDPLMTTECSLDDLNMRKRYEISTDDYSRPQLLTKLTAKLTPDQMTRDLILKPASSDDELPVKDTYPTFVENLGAAILVVINFVIALPSLVVMVLFLPFMAMGPPGLALFALALAGIIGWVSFGRTKLDVLTTLATALVTIEIIISAFILMLQAPAGMEGGAPPDTPTLLAVGLGVLGLVCIPSLIERLGGGNWATIGTFLAIADMVATGATQARWLFTLNGVILPLLLGFAVYKFFTGRKPAQMVINSSSDSQ